MQNKIKKQEAVFKKKGIESDVVPEFDQAPKGVRLPTFKDPRPDDVMPSSKSNWRK